MNFSIKEILAPIIDFWRKRSKKFKIILLSSVAAFIVLAIAMAIIINGAGYVVLYSGLSSAETNRIAVRLNEMKVSSKLESNGTILVPKDQEAKLKMQLASEGYPQSSLNYEIFSNNSNFMTTDYEKKKYLLFQLQNRLQDSIKTIKGVKNAIVTIGLPEETSYVVKEDKVPASASVVLDLEGGIELSTQQIKGIEQLIAKSVPNLDGKNVAIVSTSGVMLNNKFSNDSQGSAYTRLDLEKSISSSIENKIIKLLQPIFGAESIRVAVNTSVDINKKLSEQTTYTPVVGTNGLISRQDVSLSNGATMANNGAGGVPGTGTNGGVTTYPTGTGTGINTGAQGSGSYSTEYLNNQLKEQTTRDGYEVKDISVAIIIGNRNLTTDEIQQYRQLAATASGVNLDKISLTNAQFAKTTDTQTAQAAAAAETSKNNLMYILIAAGALGLIITVISLKMILGKRKNNAVGSVNTINKFNKKKKKKKKKGEPDDDIDEDDMITLDISGLGGKQAAYAKQEIPGEIVLNETREQGLKRQIRDFSQGNADIVAQLIRTWIKEDEDNE